MTADEPLRQRAVCRSLHDIARREGPAAAVARLYSAAGRSTPVPGLGGHALAPPSLVPRGSARIRLPVLDGAAIVAVARPGRADGVSGCPPGWAGALTWLRLGLSAGISDATVKRLSERRTADMPLLARQLVRGAIADAAGLQAEAKSALDGAGHDAVVLAEVNRLITDADRALLPLLGAHGVVIGGPGLHGYVSELLADAYLDRPERTCGLAHHL